MSGIDSLKEKARRHEQKEEWQKALDLYGQAIAKLDDEDAPDISLFNRVGDLNTRIGRSDAAVEHYERAVDLYMESELANNAIAVCKKIIRNLPNRHRVYLRMGQIRAEQGFLVDARNNFLTYAERVQGEGDIEEALRALAEFADLAPDDTDIRAALASQYAANDQPEEALRQLAHGWAVVREKGDSEAAAVFEAQAAEIDPGVDLSSVDVAVARPAVEEPGELSFETTALGGDEFATADDIDADFGDIETGSAVEKDEEDSGFADIEELSGGGAADEMEIAAEEGSGDLGGFGEIEVPGAAVVEDDDEDIGGELPLMSFDDDEEESDAILERAPIEAGLDGFSLDALGGEEDDAEEDEAAELPLMSFDDDEDEEDVGGELPLMSFDEDTAEASAAAPDDAEEGAAEQDPAEVDPAGDDAAAEAGAEVDEPADPAELFETLAAQAAAAPEDVAVPQRMVETAFRLNDDGIMARAYLALAEALQQSGAGSKAKGVYQQVLAIEPDNAAAIEGLEAAGGATRRVQEVASAEDYVDLGAMILDDDEGEKTTRFTVAYEEPSGDEAADFKKMLSQFKEKVAENFDASDVKAHHDLGTAYKEMGLLDEAIEEFQQALRASADHLPTYELLGQVFMEKGEPEAAVNTLSRALKVDWLVEDDLIGIYYHLGRAFEEVGKRSEAVEYYDKVFALDINFADVTDRLRTLR